MREARAALSLNRPDSTRPGDPLPLKGLAMAHMKKAPNREGWALGHQPNRRPASVKV